MPPIDGENNPSVTKAISQVISELNSIFNSHTSPEEFEYLLSFAVGLNETIAGIKDAIILISNNSPSTPIQIQNIISSIALLNETLSNYKLSNNVNISNLQNTLEALSTIVRTLETNLRGVDIVTITDAITNIDNTLNGILTTLVEKVNTSRTINNKPLTQDIVLTKEDINLGDVDNTSDLNKPLSIATTQALDLKITKQVSITPQTIGDSSSIPIITYNSDGLITSASTVDILVTSANVGLENVVNVDTTKASAINLDIPLEENNNNNNNNNTINVGDSLPTVISKLDNKITDTIANKIDIVSSSTLNSIPVFDEVGQLKDSLMKFNDFGSSETDILSAKAIKQEILSKITGLLDLRGNYNITDGGSITEDGKMIRRYPSTGGSGVDGMILKGDLWYITISGTGSGYIGGREVNNGDSVFALVDNPEDLDSQWSVISSAIGYTPEDSSNKTNTFLVESDILYPTTGLVKTYVDTLLNTKEDIIPPGLPNQYLSGDKTWTTIDSKTLGLGNVLNVEQLKRSGGDWISMVSKSLPSSNDLILIEDSTDIYSKKKITINSLPISSAVTDALTTFIPSSRTINSKPLTSNIILTKEDVGLSNVDNTSDLLKPLSNAAVSSLSQKVDKINLPSGDTVGSSHQVPQITYNTQGQITSITPIAISLTPSDIGLSNVINIDTTDLSNINLNGSITLSSDQVVSGDSGKVIVEKLQGQINDRVEKLSPPRENAILVSNAEGNLIDSGKVFNDQGTTSNDILSASAIANLLVNFGGLGGLEYVNDFTPLPDGTYPDGLPTKKGQLWKVISNGIVGSIEVKIGDLIVAKEDISNEGNNENNNENNNSNNWLHIQGVLGYTAENIANKESIITPTSNNRYPTSKAVCDYVLNSISDVRSVPSNGVTSEYLRGDNTWQELTKDSVGLSNVTNSSQVTREPDFSTFNMVTSVSPSDIALIESISTDGLKKHIKFQDIITSITDSINTNSTLDKLSDVNMDSPLNNYQSLVYDSTTSKWTNKMSSAEYIPIGTITSYFGVTAPTGWLMCDGSSFNQLVYNDLYTLLGTNVVPDLRGYFLRGLDNTGVVDVDGAGRALGSTQLDSFKSHTHTSNATGLEGEYGLIKRSVTGENTTQDGTNTADSGFEPDIISQPGSLNINSTGSNETRPKNVAVNFIIKAKKVGDPIYIGGFSLQGSWDAETNTPTLTSGVGTNGYYYIVSNSGTANINGVSSFWTIGDWVIFTGSNWERLVTVGGITVNTVNGYVGDVMIDKTSVGLSEVDNTSDINKPISTLVYSALGSKQSISEKDVPNGYSGLDNNGKIPLSNIPDIELNNLSDTTITNPLIKDVLIYDSVWTNRSLTPSDVGLGNVTNSSQIKRSLDFDTFLYKPVLNDTDKFLVEDNNSKNYTTLLDIKTSVTSNSMSKVQGNTNNSIAVLDSNGAVISSEIQISNDPTLGASSTTLIPTQNAVVEYVASTAIASIKRGVKAISVIPINLTTISPGVLQTSYPLIVDGVTIGVEDDILLIAQSNLAQNGIYEITEVDTTAQTISMKRCMCNDGTAGLQPGAITAVIEGTEYQGSIFYQVTQITTLEVDPIEYMIINTGVGNLKSMNNLSELTPTASIVRSNLSAAASGNNTDIKSVILDYNGLKISNETSSYHTTIMNNSSLTANRNLHIVTEDTNTTLSLIGNTTTLSGINTGDETKDSIQSKLSIATSSNDGYLTANDWLTFNNKESISNKGQPGGYPSLDAQGKISSTQLPELPSISDLKDVVLTLPLVQDQSITYDLVSGKWINRGSSANGEFIPIGTISSYFGLTAPDSWLLCNGSTFPQTTYPDLYTLLGTDVVPDLRGYFLRGLDTGRLRDEETRGLGSVQADSYKSHTHGHNGTSNTGFVTESVQNSGLIDVTSNTTESIDIQSSPIPLVISNAGGVETRPKNVAVNFIIKAKKSAKTVMLPFFSAEGSWDALSNTPTITSSEGTNGSYYIVSVAGTTTIDGNSIWNEGDWIIFTGTKWEKITNSQQLTRGSNDYTKFPSKNVLSSNDVILIEDSNSLGTKKYSTVSAIRNRGALSSVNFYPTDQQDVRDYILYIASPYMHQGNEIVTMNNYINITQGISGSMCYSKYHDSIVYLTLDAIISINPYTKESSYILHGVDFSPYNYPISDAALHRPTNRIYYSGLEMTSTSLYMNQSGSLVSFTLPSQVSYNAVVYNGTNQSVYYIPKDVITEWPYINSTGSVNTFATDVSYTSDEFVDGIYCPVNNRIYLIPGNNINSSSSNNSSNLYYIDCSTNTIMSYTYSTINSVGLKSVSAVYTPVNNRIYLIPQNVLYGTWYYIDCSTNSIIGYSVMNISSYTGNAVGCTYVPILNRIYIGNGMLESQYLYIDCFKDEVNMYAPIDEPAYGSGRGDGIYSMGSIYFPPTETLTVNTRIDLKINDTLPSYVSITMP